MVSRALVIDQTDVQLDVEWSWLNDKDGMTLRDEIGEVPAKPLLPKRWAGAVDAWAPQRLPACFDAATPTGEEERS